LRLSNYNKPNPTTTIASPENPPVEGHQLELISSIEAVCGSDDDEPSGNATKADPEKPSIEEHQLELISSTEAVYGADEDEPSLPEKHPRKASDQTILSEGSKTSNATVYHRPSRHVSFLADTSETETETQYVPGITYATLDSPKYAPLFARSRAGSRDILVGSSESLGGDTYVFESSDYAPPAISSLPEYAIPQRLFSDTGLQSRQEDALDAFNVLAKQYGLYTLIRPENDPISKCQQ
jgi:hypothetical protein